MIVPFFLLLLNGTTYSFKVNIPRLELKWADLPREREREKEAGGGE